jgi:hypothetical protein
MLTTSRNERDMKGIVSKLAITVAAAVSALAVAGAFPAVASAAPYHGAMTVDCQDGQAIAKFPTSVLASGYRQEKLFSRVYLYRWDGSRWTFVQSSPWLWSIVTSSGLSTVAGFVLPNGNVTASFPFGIEQAGYYRVAVRYVWGTGPTAYEWAGNHRTVDATWGDLFGTNGAYCTYR